MLKNEQEIKQQRMNCIWGNHAVFVASKVSVYSRGNCVSMYLNRRLAS